MWVKYEDEKKIYGAYFDSLKFFGKNGSIKFNAKKLDEDDTEGGDGNDNDLEWLKKLGEILEKYESLTKLNVYFTLIVTILKAAWLIYKYILRPGYVIRKKLLEAKPSK
ncbi:hypothetical protein POM88_022331 [Heracleum sosnowskyi]|uniref:Uncharacterized protein n=1 Tax=Heracleum sosnowskyi TaxID=360622 RepID=A0AAD8IGM8_9APIA|nr:hypothetical protein POM88_022331 [Heracleum sosnowskyi]